MFTLTSKNFERLQFEFDFQKRLKECDRKYNFLSYEVNIKFLYFKKVDIEASRIEDCQPRLFFN